MKWEVAVVYFDLPVVTVWRNPWQISQLIPQAKEVFFRMLLSKFHGEICFCVFEQRSCVQYFLSRIVIFPGISLYLNLYIIVLFFKKNIPSFYFISGTVTVRYLFNF